MSLLDAIAAAKVAIHDLLTLETMIGDSPEFAAVEQDIRNVLTAFEQTSNVSVRPTAAHYSSNTRTLKAASVLSVVELIGTYAVTYGPAFLDALKKILDIIAGATTQAEAHETAEAKKAAPATKPADKPGQ